MVNGQHPAAYNVMSPRTTQSNFGPGAESTLIIPGSYELDGALVTCYYNPSMASLSLHSTPAFLRVQGL